MFQNPFIADKGHLYLSRLVCVLILALFAVSPCFAQKADEVYLLNGERITGDVKSLDGKIGLGLS